MAFVEQVHYFFAIYERGCQRVEEFMIGGEGE